MGYRIVTKDFTIEVDSLIEFQNALNTLRNLEGKNITPAIPESIPRPRPLLAPEPTERLTVANKMVSFYRNLVGDTRNLIIALYDKPEGLTSLELQGALNTTSSGIGGVMGGVTKAAKPFGLHKEDIVSYVGDRYQLTPSIRDVIRGEVEKKSEPKV